MFISRRYLIGRQFQSNLICDCVRCGCMIAEEEEIESQKQGKEETEDNEYDLDGLFHSVTIRTIIIFPSCSVLNLFLLPRLVLNQDH